jgi:beta-1,4-mannosyl-glycoprotein beta-1,4-N-acetylglucosaminyltransferase
MKIIDCFLFYNELDLLNYRLNILNGTVDYFVIIESTHTFTGHKKNLLYDENKHMFEFFESKIIHIVVDDFPHKYPNINYINKEQWNNEAHQRNAFAKGFNRIELNDEDIITITDIDEIPDPETLEKIKNGNQIVDLNILQMDMYYYNLNSLLVNSWPFVKIVSYKTFKSASKTCDELRWLQNCSIIPRGGWHLSYFGDSNFIKNKINNFSHQEFNTDEFTNIENIENRIKNGSDLFDRNENKILKVSIKDNLYLPYKYKKYLQKYIIE